MDGIDDWQGRNDFPGFTRLLTSHATSRIFASLSAARQNNFFKSWVKRALSGGSVCSDMSEHIDRLKAELSKLKRYPQSKLKRFSPYFIITKHENDSGFDDVVNSANIEKMRESKGDFLIFRQT